MGEKTLVAPAVVRSQNARNLKRDVSMGEADTITEFERLNESTRGRIRPWWAARPVIVWLACLLGACATAWGQDRPTIGGKSLGHWVAALKGDNPEARHTACTAISLLGPAAKDAVSTLIGLLDDPRQDVQKAAIESLLEIGPDSARAAPRLVLKLGNPDFMRNNGIMGSGATHLAADALVAIGTPAVPALVASLRSNSADAREMAAMTLGRIGPAARDAVPALARMLTHRVVLQDLMAADALGKIGPAAAQASPALNAAYDSLRPEERDDGDTILEALRAIGAAPSPGLIRQLDDPDPERRVKVAILLGEFGPAARAAVGPLQAALGDLSRQFRVQAAAALVRIDPSNARALPILLLALDSNEQELVFPALAAIAELGTRGAPAAPKLRKIVRANGVAYTSSDGTHFEGTIHGIKADAAKALVLVSPGSGEGIAALLTLLRQEDGAQGVAISALEELGPKAAAAVPALAAIATDPSSNYCFYATKALASINPQHPAILPAFIGLLSARSLRSVDRHAENEVITSLGLMGSKARPAVPALVKFLNDSSEEERQFAGPAEKAAEAVGRIGPPAQDALLALIDAMKTEHYVRMAAAQSLVLMGTEAAPAIPELIAFLKTKETRPWALRVLGAVGPKAQAAVPAIVEAMNDANPFVVADAGSALLSIDPSKRGVVEARLSAMREMSHFYAIAVLTGALGKRSAEATGLTRQTLRAMNSGLAEIERAIGSGNQTAGSRTVDIIEPHLQYLADLGAGAADAVPCLTGLTNHVDPLVQRLAAETLRRVHAK